MKTYFMINIHIVWENGVYLFLNDLLEFDWRDKEGRMKCIHPIFPQLLAVILIFNIQHD